MHLGQRGGERESGAGHRVGEPVRRDVGGGAERHAIDVQDASFGHHLNLFLKVAASRRRAVDTAAAGVNSESSQWAGKWTAGAGTAGAASRSGATRIGSVRSGARRAASTGASERAGSVNSSGSGAAGG